MRIPAAAAAPCHFTGRREKGNESVICLPARKGQRAPSFAGAGQRVPSLAARREKGNELRHLPAGAKRATSSVICRPARKGQRAPSFAGRREKGNELRQEDLDLPQPGCVEVQPGPSCPRTGHRMRRRPGVFAPAPLAAARSWYSALSCLASADSGELACCRSSQPASFAVAAEAAATASTGAAEVMSAIRTV